MSSYRPQTPAPRKPHQTSLQEEEVEGGEEEVEGGEEEVVGGEEEMEEDVWRRGGWLRKEGIWTAYLEPNSNQTLTTPTNHKQPLTAIYSF